MLNTCIAEKVEILIVNDGSTDSTQEKAERYARNHPSTIRVLNKENGGHGSCLNLGIREARGRYVRVVDGDDWVDTDAFVKYVRYLEGTDSDVVVSNYAIQFVNNGRIKFVDYGMGSESFAFDSIAENIKQITIQSMTILTAIIRDNDIRFTENCYYEDSEFITFPFKYVKSIDFTEDCVYQYRMGTSGQSVNASNAIRNREMLHRIMISLVEFGQRERTAMNAPVRQYLDSIIVSRIHNYYGLLLKLPYGDKAKELINLTNKELKDCYPTYYDLSNNSGIGFLRKNLGQSYPLAYIAFCVKRAIRGF